MPRAQTTAAAFLFVLDAEYTRRCRIGRVSTTIGKAGGLVWIYSNTKTWQEARVINDSHDRPPYNTDGAADAPLSGALEAGDGLLEGETPELDPAFAETPKQSCSACGGRFPRMELAIFRDRPLCGRCKETFLLHLRQGTLPDPHAIPYSLLKRGLAKLIDLHTPFILFSSHMYILELLGLDETTFVVFGFLLCLLLYLAIITFATGRFGGSPGKLVFRLAVVDRRGEAVDYVAAFLRTMAEFLSMLSLGAGYVAAFADGHCRTLHDRICQTWVVVRE